jgi:hypothetical protein
MNKFEITSPDTNELSWSELPAGTLITNEHDQLLMKLKSGYDYTVVSLISGIVQQYPPSVFTVLPKGTTIKLL